MAATCLVLAGRVPGPGRLRGESAGAPPPTIRRLILPAESAQRYPIAIPTDPEHSVELDFPWPVVDWAGRGFTPDPEAFAGDFLVDASRGSPRIFVTPLVSGGHRILHLIGQPPGAPPRSVPLEFVAAPAGEAWHKVVLVEAAPASVEPDAAPSASEDTRRPAALTARTDPQTFREPTAADELALIRLMRRLRGLSSHEAAALLAQQAALEWDDHARLPHSFGPFTLRLAFALHDAATDCLGLCVELRNATARRLVFDADSWVVRSGERVYPVRTVDFTHEVEPESVQTAWLVLARSPDGTPIRLRPDRELSVSVRLAASVNPKPMLRFPVDSLSGGSAAWP
jgi:hypothetical protein